MDRAPRTPTAELAVVAVATAVALWHATRFAGFVCDDAVISFRSVDNWHLGHGFVFNVGERLETFTNLGFVWLLAVARALGVEPFAGATVLGVAAAVATVPASWWLARELGLRRAAPIVPLYVAATTTLMGQAGSGLETTACALLTTLGVARLLSECRPRVDDRPVRDGIGAALLAGAVLLRPDSALVLGGLLVCKPFLLPPDRRRRAVGRDVVVAVVAVGAPFVFRQAYYGRLLPNPVHAKVGLSNLSPAIGKQGLTYAFEWLRTDFGIAVLAGGLVLAFAANGRARALAVLCTGWCLYVVGSGGDHMPYARFFAPMLAVFAATFVAGWGAVFGDGGRWRRGAGLVFAAALAVQPVWLSVSRGNVPARNMAHETYRREIGEWFAQEAAARGGRLVVACNPVGYIGHFAGPGVRIVDMLGLCDEHIATSGRRDARLLAGHQVGDGPYVLEQAPDFVLLGTVTPGDPWQRQDAAALLREVRATGVEAWAAAHDHALLVSEREMLVRDELVRDYELVKVALPSGRPLQVLRRRR